MRGIFNKSRGTILAPKILFLTDDFPPILGGISTYSYEITKSLKELGEDVIVLAPKDEGYKEFDENCNIKIIRRWFPRFQHGYYIKVLLLFFYLLYYVKKYNINIIHCATWLPCGVASLPLCKILKIPYTVTTYALDVLNPQVSKFRTMVMKLVLKNAKKIISISNYTRGILLELGISKENIEVIPLGVNYERFDADIDYSDIIKKHTIQDKKVILTVSTLIYSYKGHDKVIKSLPKVLEKVPNVVYLIVGEGPLRKSLEKIVEELKLENHVIFAGFVPHEDVALLKYYKACDVFIMPSGGDEKKGHVEGFGLVYLEANACGKPVIGGRCGGTLDAIVDGETGLLVNPSDIDEIAEALIKILTDESYAHRLGMNGRKRVENDFDWKIIAKKTIKVINS